MPKETITAVYTIKNEGRNINKLAKDIAIGQTLGAWDEISGNIRVNISKHLGEVLSVEEGEYSSSIKIAYPILNFGSDLGALLTCVYGKISLAQKIKLENIELSEEYLKLFEGPLHGINGIRKITGKTTGPFLMSIFKPCLGLTPSELGEMFLTQAEAGMDFVKDDEILYDKKIDSALRRLEACLNAKEKANAKTLYAINLTGPASEIIERGLLLEHNGANCILFNYLSYGLPLLHSLREKLSIPIMAHPAFAGAMCLNNFSGLSEPLLLGKLPRLGGADFVLFPSPYGSLAWDKEITKSIQNELTCNLTNIEKTLPVPSAGIKKEMVNEIISDFGNDIVINAGTAVWRHESGGKEGAKEFLKEIEKLELRKVSQ